MHPAVQQKSADFADRRQEVPDSYRGPDRRQFRDERSECRPEVRELGEAIDQYKMVHRRRFITFEELFSVIEELGYHK